jgi:RimJ/RimL family protein N-acetyltransferase
MFNSDRLFLREFCDDDFEAVHAYGSDPEVVRYMVWGPNSEEETRDFLERAQARAKVDPRAEYDFAVTLADTGELIGGIGIYVDGSNAMLGYCFARPVWGNGYASEAARLIVDLGFGSLGVHRVWAGCDPENVGSIGVLEKLGMTREGHLREECQIRGEWRDTLVFGILADEWSGVESKRKDQPEGLL